jgi:thiosulfate reductase cytochrome b subunit
MMHWISAGCFFLLLMSGLTIFNAHPNLYWGQGSHFDTPLLSLSARQGPDGKLQGVTRVFGLEFNTTGILGASRVLDDKELSARAFPSWAAVPSRQWLSMARRWHLFFAWIFVLNGIAYISYAIFSGHLRRDLLPTSAEWRNILTSVKDHLLFRHPVGEAAKRYNILQNLSYLAVIFGMLPLLVIAGLGMSPRLNALFDGGWVELLGGRQSARTLHFIAAFALLGFVAVHVFEAAVTGLWNNLRSMITGNYRLPADSEPWDTKS